MKTYKYNDGSKIEIEVKNGAPDVVFAMGEYYVGDCRTEKTFHATASNGLSQACETWEEAKRFLLDNTEK